MEKEKKDKLMSISLWALLAVVILFVIITTSIIKTKQKYLEDLNDQNQELDGKLPDQDQQDDEILKIFLKTLKIF